MTEMTKVYPFKWEEDFKDEVKRINHSLTKDWVGSISENMWMPKAYMEIAERVYIIWKLDLMIFSTKESFEIGKITLLVRNLMFAINRLPKIQKTLPCKFQQ